MKIVSEKQSVSQLIPGCTAPLHKQLKTFIYDSFKEYSILHVRINFNHFYSIIFAFFHFGDEDFSPGRIIRWNFAAHTQNLI